MKGKLLYVLALASLTTPVRSNTLNDLIVKLLTAPNYLLVPNVLDNQPVPTDTCDVSNRAHTESATGDGIGVRQYGCILQGRNVVFTVSIPKACETSRCGLIVDQHGATMNAEQQNAGTHLREYGWRAVQYGAPTPYIVIQPNMTDLLDNASGKLDLASVTGSAYSNELPIVMTFVQNVIQALNVDTQRVHFHGFSRGGATGNQIYCDESLAKVFASYVGTGASLGCALNRPYMQVNGLTDPNIAMANLITAKMRLNGATAEVLTQDPNWQTPTIGFVSGKLSVTGKLQHTRYSKGSLKLENINHSGAALPLAGHCLPHQGPARWLVCPATFDLGRKVLDFFIQNPAVSNAPLIPR